MSSVADRIRLHLDEPLFRTAWSLMASTLLTALLGVGFWAVAARLFSVQVVGRDSVLIASMMAISLICQLNLGNVIVRFLPQVHHKIGRRIINAYSAAACLSLLLGLLFVMLVPSLSPRFAFFNSDPIGAAVFVVALAVWSIFTLEDAVLTSLGFATWLPIENGFYSAAKLVMLPLAFLLGGSHDVFLAWVVPLAIVVPTINLLIARRVVPHATHSQLDAPGVIAVFGLRPLVVFLLQDFFGSAASQIAIVALPLVVLAQLGSAASAYFYIPFALVTTFDFLSLALAVSLTTQVARTPHRVQELTYAVIKRFCLLGLPIIVVIIAAAPLIMVPFGSQYVENSTGLLRLLAAGSCLRATIYLYSAIARLQGRGLRIVVPQASVAILLLAMTIVFSVRYGLDGIGWAWLLTFCVVAAMVLPGLVRFLRDPKVPALPAAGERPRYEMVER